MDSYATLLVDERIEQLRREAAERHAHPSTSSAIARRIGATLTALTAAVMTPANSRESAILPTLIDYPYRG